MLLYNFFCDIQVSFNNVTTKMFFKVLSVIWFPKCDVFLQPSFLDKDLLIQIQSVYSLYVPVLLMKVFLGHTRGKLLREI